MNRHKKLWKKNWCRLLGTIALSSGLVFTEMSVAYGATSDMPLKNVTVKESVKPEQLPIEEYLMQCWEKKQERIDMKPYKMTMEQLNSVIFNLHKEKPELYWVLRNQAFEENKQTGLLETYVQYYEGRTGQPLDRSEELEREWEIVKAKTENCKTDLEKAMVVHDHLCETITYSEELGVASHDIEGAILEKRAVCEGYALAYKYYMNRLGIPCKVMGGIAQGPHAWNQVQINGKWYLVDATWDDSRDKKTNHKYFLCSENIFDSHTWDKEAYETCNDTTYDNASWRRNSKVICGYDGGLYYADGKIDPSTHKFESGIFRYDAENPEKTDELVISIDESWKESVNTSTTLKGASELAYYKGNLYYNTPKAIWKWNFKKDAKPEKVLDLSSDVKGEIWDIEIDGGTLLYETAEGESGKRKLHEYQLDKTYQKAKHPIAVTKKSMTVELGRREVFLQGAAPGKLSYTSKNPEICGTNVVWKDESCQLIPKKAGETQVIVHAEETNRYLAGDVVVNVKVVDKGTAVERYEIQATSPKTIPYGDAGTVDIKIVNVDTGEVVDSSDKNLKVRPSQNITYANGKITANDVGEYSLTITANDMQEVVVKGTVVKRKATVKPNSIERDKKDKHIEPTVTVENSVAADKNKDFGITMTCAVNQNTPVGEYPITVSGGNAYFLSHYEPTYVNGTYKILGVQNITLHYSADENGSLKAVKAGTDTELKDGQEIEPNTEVKFTATPKENYVVKHWIVNGNVQKVNGKVYTGNTFTHRITSSTDNVQVEFVKANKEKHYQISTKAVYEDGTVATDAVIRVKDNAGNTILSGSNVLEGTKITAEANCPQKISIVKWVVNGKDYSSQKTVSFTVNADTEIKLVVKKKAEEHIHVYNLEKVSDKYKASNATCTEPAKYYKSCACGEHGDTTFSYGKALGHTYGEPVWNWSSDNKSAEAVFTCKRDNNHMKKMNAEITKKVTKKPTCTEMGEVTYSASVTLSGNVSTNTKTIKEIAALGHKFENGECTVCGTMSSDYKKYEVTDGENPVWIKESKENVVIGIPTEIGNVIQITLDGKGLQKEDYSVLDGKLTIKADALEKMSVGKYVVRIRGEKGYAETTITVKKKEVVKPTEPVKPEKPNDANQNTDGKGVKTGDSNNIMLLFTLAGGAMLTGIFAYSKKQKKETES